MRRILFLLLLMALTFSLIPAHAQTAEETAPKEDAQSALSPEKALLSQEALNGIDPFMYEAVLEALDGITHGHGGPFGSVVVRNGEIVGRGHNQVLLSHDPTWHGEIGAIRDACAALGTYDLSGCELYTTGEPCPMCLFACLWANIEKVYYGCTIGDNALIGFRDEKFDQLSGGREQLSDYLYCIDRDACLALFEAYLNMSHQLY